MPIPQTIGHEITARLTRCLKRGRLLDKNSTEFASIEREIRRLMQIEPANAYAALGALYGLSGDLESLRANYSKAQRLTRDLGISCNYAISLANLGYFSEAIKEIESCERADSGHLENAILLNLEAGRFQRAVRLIDLWNDLHQECPWVENNLSEVAQLLEGAGIGDNDLLPCLDTLGSVLRDHGLIFLDEPVIRIVDDSGSKGLSFRFLVGTSPRNTADLEAILVDRLFDAAIELHETTVRFGFIAAEELIKQAA